MNRLELYYPTKPTILLQAFGLNVDYYKKLVGTNGHNGLDYKLGTDKYIRAAHDGEVTFCGEDGSAGQGVVIRTLEQFEYKGEPTYFKSIYWHLEKGKIFVSPGEKVKTGKILAIGDNTGLSTGPHLHFGLKPVYKGENNWTWCNIEQQNGFYGAIDPQLFFTGVSAEHAPTWNLIRKMTDNLMVRIKLLAELVKLS